MPDGAQDKDHPERRRMEACGSILAATTKLDPITDDNMGTEWRYPLGFE